VFATEVMNVIVAEDTAQGEQTMKYFTIDPENCITIHSSRKAARDTGAGVFSTEEQFAELIGADSKRLVEIWNSLTGVKPVTKFANRKAGVARIWAAIQQLGGSASMPAPEVEVATEPAVAQTSFDAVEEMPNAPVVAVDEASAIVGAQAPDVAPAPTESSKKAARAKKAPKAAPAANETRAGTKSAIILELLKRPDGVTLQELMTATSWLKHSIRGYISTMQKKTGLTVLSVKTEDGGRRYSIKTMRSVAEPAGGTNS
jgi:hypothetical protein